MLRPPRLMAWAASAGLAWSLAATPAGAGDAVYLANDASHCDIFRAINPDVPDECLLPGERNGFAGLKTRSIRTRASGGAAEGFVDTAATDQDFSLAMQIQFALDSDKLALDAQMVLDRVAIVLNDELMKDKVILLEGHADATGEETYNLDLSNRRALAVKKYLIERHGVAPERIQSVGKGELEPYDRQEPDAPINRRVEFTNLTG